MTTDIRCRNWAATTSTTEPRTLIGGESAVVTPGTVIELGDGNLIELLEPESRPESRTDPGPASAPSPGARS